MRSPKSNRRYWSAWAQSWNGSMWRGCSRASNSLRSNWGRRRQLSGQLRQTPSRAEFPRRGASAGPLAQAGPQGTPCGPDQPARTAHRIRLLPGISPPGCLGERAAHLLPDPWPKRKHRRNRLVNGPFTGIAQQALAPGGLVFLRTDDADYFAQMVSVFAADVAFKPVETPGELSAVLTDFEQSFLARGIATQRAAYQKSG